MSGLLFKTGAGRVFKTMKKEINKEELFNLIAKKLDLILEDLNDLANDCNNFGDFLINYAEFAIAHLNLLRSIILHMKMEKHDKNN